ncbi:GMP synthase [Nocardioides sp. CF8]|uniref:glutamine-hydrolyzing GMP synthase n=1 Tax=Nocardioides sp. CF8 TaxID=110319 RepID=UPI00032F4966|nr:glutamine-hydrolyzing GMP synthase [Nocardioides sp. CF8]EON22952.1 GMP synthase [Nocardioides sp. CF8]
MTANPDHDLVLVVDFGAQYAQLIARRVREARVYSEIVPHSLPVADMLARKPKAIILSGGPSSVYADGAPRIDTAIFTAGVPVFGMCYGFQLMASGLGGEVAHTGAREYGRTPVSVTTPGTLLAGIPETHNVWMSHGDSVASAPEGFTVLASTDVTPVAAFEDVARGLAGVQWHPEVLHSEHGQQVLEHFLHEIAGCRQTWTMVNIVEEQVERIREQIGENGRAICALSGGVDSAVAAAIVQRAIGDRLTCVYVDHGMMRKGETEQVKRDFEEVFDALDVVDAADQFLDALAGVHDPEEKRKIIGREFIRTFEAAEVRVFGGLAGGDATAWLVQGTLYPDVVESGGGAGTSTIKSHHNVGGLPDDLQFELVEPLRTLFKDEVRAVGEQLGLPSTMVWRQPFPGPGLGIRIIGEVTRERLDLLREADAIAREELTRAGLDREIWQMPVVLLADVRSVGVQGDGRTYGHPVVLRPVTSEDAMTADWARLPYEVMEKISTRITNEVADINRVTIDITSKPPGTIEWE